MSLTRMEMKVVAMDEFNRTCCICNTVHDLVYDLPSPAHGGRWGHFCESCRLKNMIPYSTIGTICVISGHAEDPAIVAKTNDAMHDAQNDPDYNNDL